MPALAIFTFVLGFAFGILVSFFVRVVQDAESKRK